MDESPLAIRKTVGGLAISCATLPARPAPMTAAAVTRLLTPFLERALGAHTSP